MKPQFKKREIIVEKQEKETKLGGGNIKETVGIVKYVGDKVENYKIGDTILFDLAVARLQIDYFEKPLLRIEHEDYIICQIVKDE